MAGQASHILPLRDCSNSFCFFTSHELDWEKGDRKDRALGSKDKEEFRSSDVD